jgi:hypothetical protein
VARSKFYRLSVVFLRIISAAPIVASVFVALARRADNPTPKSERTQPQLPQIHPQNEMAITHKQRFADFGRSGDDTCKPYN